jgi:hypothetical protein
MTVGNTNGPGAATSGANEGGSPDRGNGFEDDNLVGVIKIKDGLFICDQYGAQDLEFIISNKVLRIVNTAGMQLTNHWDSIGV